MRKSLLLFVLCAALVSGAETKTNFSGTWEFTAAKSKNVGMMAAMKLTSTIQQTAETLTETNRSVMNGQESSKETVYNLKGKEVSNDDFMGTKNVTVSRWEDGKLITTWTSDGAVAGSKVVRTETRYLSSDGRTMTVESKRGSNAAIEMVFDKK